MPGEPPALPSAAQLFDEVPCGLLVTSSTGVILMVNRTFCDWVGMPAAELVGQRKFAELLTMGGRIFHQTHWMPMLQMQGSLSEVKLDIRHRDGRVIPVMVNTIRRHHEGTVFDEVSVTVADERNKYERELLLARKRADELVAKERDAQAALRVAQARLAQALAGGAMFVWGVDVGGRRTYGDEVACLLGHESPRPVDEDAVLAAMPPQERAAEQAMLAEALTNPGRSPGSTRCRVSTAGAAWSRPPDNRSSMRTDPSPSSSASCRTSPRSNRCARPPRTVPCSRSRWWASSAMTCAIPCPPS
jgi:phosphoserine phosphatase RsbU/P